MDDDGFELVQLDVSKPVEMYGASLWIIHGWDLYTREYLSFGAKALEVKALVEGLREITEPGGGWEDLPPQLILVPEHAIHSREMTSS